VSNERRLLEEWQKRLGLQDWKIKLCNNCKPENMDVQDAEGCTTWVESTKCAEIQMLDEKLYPENCVGRGPDWERCLVHELLHCKLSFLQDSDSGTLQSRVCHQLIDDLARAFVDAKRWGTELEEQEAASDAKPV
jgi:hypothetical protein